MCVFLICIGTNKSLIETKFTILLYSLMCHDACVQSDRLPKMRS